MSTWRDRFVNPSTKTSDDGRPDLAAVLEHYGVDLLPYRTRQMVHCPLHEDNTSSCSINTDKQVWNCHSCGEGGDSYRLIMKMEDTDFDGARAFAAALGFAEGGAEGSGDELPVSAYGSRRKAPARKGRNPGNSGFVPSWKRR